MLALHYLPQHSNLQDTEDVADIVDVEDVEYFEGAEDTMDVEYIVDEDLERYIQGDLYIEYFDHVQLKYVAADFLIILGIAFEELTGAE